MRKLYLIRRNIYNFLGPMTLEELKNSYAKMEFGLQDEISSSCGPWVPLDSVKQLKTLYPEVRQILSLGLNNPWSDVASSVISDIDNKSQINVSIKRPKPSAAKIPDKKNLITASILIAFSLFASFLAFLYLNHNMSLQALLNNLSLSPNKAQDFLDRGEMKLFDEYMEKNKEPIVQGLAGSIDHQQSWLPFLRTYAFHHQGIIPGLKTSILRGDVPYAPSECSLAFWKAQWLENESKIKSFTNGQILHKSSWTRLLLWDVHWILRRPSPGWLSPKNYYEACIIMAHKAFYELNSSTLFRNRQDIGTIDPYLIQVARRLNWQMFAIGQVQKPKDNIEIQSRSPLALWTCMEHAQTYQEVGQCQLTPVPRYSEWSKLYDSKLMLSYLHLSTKREERTPVNVLKEIERKRSALHTSTPNFTLLNTTPELSYLNELVKAQGQRHRTLDVLSTQYPEIDFVSNPLQN